MGWSQPNGKPRIILKGKLNYAVWVPACLFELRAEKAGRALEMDEVEDPQSLTEEQQRKAINTFIARTEALPTDGQFSDALIAANKGKWLAAAETKYEKWYELNEKAMGVIYSLCESLQRKRLRKINGLDLRRPTRSKGSLLPTIYYHNLTNTL
jgi:hypothetical protein